MVPFCQEPVAKHCEHGWLCRWHECGDEFEDDDLEL
jgi:hypothetical protein